MEFQEPIEPFFWVEQESGASVCLDAGGYLQEVFDTRADEGFEGNRYDWGSLARVFLEECRPDLTGKIGMDPEAGLFCASSKDADALREVAIAFKAAREDRALILDRMGRAELD